MKKINMITVLFVFGVFLILISTFYFAFKIPTLDSEIDAKKREVDSTFAIFNRAEHLSIQDLLSIHHKDLLIGINSSRFRNINRQLHQIRIDKYMHLAAFVRGEEPSEEYEKSLDNLNSSQLNQLVLDLATEPNNLPKLIGELKELQKTKKKVLFYSVLTQILGLLVINIATLFQIRWFLHKKK